MRKEFFLLMTFVGIGDYMCMISPRENQTIRLSYFTMEREIDGIPSKLNSCQNSAQNNVLYAHCSSNLQTQCSIYKEIARNCHGNWRQESRDICSPGLPFGLHFPSIQEFTMLTLYSKLETLNVRASQTSLRLHQLTIRTIVFILLHIFIKRNTDNSSMAAILFYSELSLLVPALSPAQAVIQSTGTQSLFSSSAATPSLNSSSKFILSNYSFSRELPMVTPTAVWNTSNNTVPSTAWFKMKLQVTDTSLSSAKKNVPHWFIQDLSGCFIIESSGPCRSTFVYFNKICYKFLKEPLVFNQAARQCRNIGSNITSVLSQKENDFIYNLTGYISGRTGNIRIWLGLERLMSSGKLEWTDKNVLSYQNFEAGEPNGDGACVEMSEKGHWRDTSCNVPLGFVCKVAPTDPPPFSRTIELVIMVGIPLVCVTIMLTVVSILVMRSIKEADGTLMGFGDVTEKENVQTSLVNVTASIAHVSTQGYSSDSRASISSGGKPISHHSSPCQSPDVKPNGTSMFQGLEIPELIKQEEVLREVIKPEVVQPEVVQVEEEKDVEQHEMVIFRSNTSLASGQSQCRFQSTTSLDHLVAKSYIKPKSRRLRSLRKPEGVVTPAGREGKYVKKTP